MGKRTFRNCRFYRSGDVLFTDMEVFKGQGNDTDTSEEFEKYLQDQGMLHSFSRKGNPYDNACIELVLCQDLVQVKMRNFSPF